jgi:hypothetical protein
LYENNENQSSSSQKSSPSPNYATDKTKSDRKMEETDARNKIKIDRYSPKELSLHLVSLTFIETTTEYD